MCSKPILAILCLFLSAGPRLQPQDRPGAAANLKSLQLPMASLHSLATIELGGKPDWMAISEDAVWVSNGPLKAVHRVTAEHNSVAVKIEFPAEPCSGLVFAFGTLWVPLCGDQPALARVQPVDNKIVATLRIGPADDEGGITASDDAVWLASAKDTLLRIDPATNTVRQKIALPSGCANPLYADGIVWVSCNQSGVLTPVDARSGEVLTAIPVGPQPRFLTAGSGSIWTLNQGDGTITRVDMRTRQAVATIAAGIPGHGGEITFGAGSVWATMIDVPLTQISSATNMVVHQ